MYELYRYQNARYDDKNLAEYLTEATGHGPFWSANIPPAIKKLFGKGFKFILTFRLSSALEVQTNLRRDVWNSIFMHRGWWNYCLFAKCFECEAYNYYTFGPLDIINVTEDIWGSDDRNYEGSRPLQSNTV